MDGEGHKFGLPSLPLPEGSHLKHREDPLVHQVTQLMMKDGKKNIAQRVGRGEFGKTSSGTDHWF